MRITESLFIFLLLFPSMSKAQSDSLDIMIGQMIMTGFSGKTISDDSLVNQDLRDGLVGGILLFEKNISEKNSWTQLKLLINSLQEMAPNPLWIAIDQEGGRVNRLKTKYGFPPSVTASYLGKVNNIDTTQFYAQLTASTLSGLGINVNFAPDVDLATNPTNPVIAKPGRAYSSEYPIVYKHASVVINEHRSYGVLTVPKHFPGHGSSTTDSHLGIADVSGTWNPKELKPYSLLIDSIGLDAIMSAHIVNRQLDSTAQPSTLSKPVLTGLLRDSLAFDGMIFSDDMQMHAITKYFGRKEAVKLAIQAGVDVLIFSNNISGSTESTAREIHSYVKNLVDTGVISEERIRQSFERIQAAKNRYVSFSRL